MLGISEGVSCAQIKLGLCLCVTNKTTIGEESLFYLRVCAYNTNRMRKLCQLLITDNAHK